MFDSVSGLNKRIDELEEHKIHLLEKLKSMVSFNTISYFHYIFYREIAVVQTILLKHKSQIRSKPKSLRIPLRQILTTIRKRIVHKGTKNMKKNKPNQNLKVCQQIQKHHLMISKKMIFEVLNLYRIDIQNSQIVKEGNISIYQD